MTPVLPTQPITVPELAARFKRGHRWAAKVMRRMRHVGNTADNMFTTEEWLAVWLAAKSIPALNWPPPGEMLDPLEEAVQSRVLQLVGALARAGKISVVAA